MPALTRIYIKVNNMDFVLWAMMGLLVLYIVRALLGPSVWDRLLSMNLIATKIIVIIVIYASVSGVAFMLDFAIIYALSGFIGTIFIVLFISERRLGKRRGKRKGRDSK